MSLEEKIKQLKGPIFLFGASGFIGANLLETILKYRTDCYAITHHPRSAWRLKLLAIPLENILHCDINYKKSVEMIFRQHTPQTIFNLSGYGGYSKQTNSSLIYHTNLGGTLNILEACQNIAAYVHAGSSSEYGANSANPRETDSLEANSHYAVSKISTGYLVNFYARCHRLPCVNLRLYSIYGPWEEPDRLLPKMVEAGLNKEYPVLADPTTSRDFVYVDDCIEAFVDTAVGIHEEIFGESFNIGTGIKTTLQQLAAVCRSHFEIPSKPKFNTLPNRSWDTEEWYGNFNKAEQAFGWRPKTSLETGIQKVAAWQQQINYPEVVLPAFQTPQKLAKISVVIACYKDGQAIPVLYDRLVETFQKLGCPYEIIFVNDNSPDDSEQILHEICEKDLHVIAIKHSRNFGSQAAFISGMEIATGDAVVIMDGDLQDPPELIISFFDQWQKGYQVVYGNRIKREATWLMNLAYRSFYKLFSRMSNIQIPKNAGDFSLMDRKVVEHLIAMPEKEQFIRGLRAWLGFRQIGVDYVRPERMFGTSTNNLHKNIGWAKKGILSFSYLPLEIMSYTGFFLTIASFLAIAFQIIYKIMYPDLPHGIPTIIVLVLFFGGVQLLAISLLGEYLSKVVDETKSRPKFIRDKVIMKGRTIETNRELENLLKQ
jgi:polyisoprenyl-phosphate glycosyltransferase